jgi:hypothetical protein
MKVGSSMTCGGKVGRVRTIAGVMQIWGMRGRIDVTR